MVIIEEGRKGLKRHASFFEWTKQAKPQ